mmetsp:Transcript_92801/g.139275  ORF Transcript_92801/g.139275 Transcript_92801/m.139275 type:complete len:93 (-) Transcript_92801:52-330(-)
MRISSSCLNFKNSIFNGNQTHIKSSTTKIKNKNILFSFFFLIKSISNSSSCRFVNNSFDLKTSNNSSIFCSLSLCIIKISRYSDNSRFNRIS